MSLLVFQMISQCLQDTKVWNQKSDISMNSNNFQHIPSKPNVQSFPGSFSIYIPKYLSET